MNNINEVRIAQIRAQARRHFAAGPRLKTNRWYRCAGECFKVVSVNRSGATVLRKDGKGTQTISAHADAKLITPREARGNG